MIQSTTADNLWCLQRSHVTGLGVYNDVLSRFITERYDDTVPLYVATCTGYVVTSLQMEKISWYAFIYCPIFCLIFFILLYYVCCFFSFLPAQYFYIIELINMFNRLKPSVEFSCVYIAFSAFYNFSWICFCFLCLFLVVNV